MLYPLVEASEKVDLADATRGAEGWLPAGPGVVSLLHGRLRREEKDQAMEDFRRGRTEVLVCTTVVEVGVDVANASVMVVQNAERFGLSQLHQLRGRSGAGSGRVVLLRCPPGRTVSAPRPGWRCWSRAPTASSSPRRTSSCAAREFLGTRQSGLPEQSVAIWGGSALSAVASGEARAIAEADPRLQRPEHRPW